MLHMNIQSVHEISAGKTNKLFEADLSNTVAPSGHAVLGNKLRVNMFA